MFCQCKSFIKGGMQEQIVNTYWTDSVVPSTLLLHRFTYEYENKLTLVSTKHPLSQVLAYVPKSVLSRKIIFLCVNIYINSNNKMERKTFAVKIEPEEDLEYHLHYEENFEIKSEVDLPIKLEESLKGEVHDNEEPDCCPGPITDPPTKKELNDYQEPECYISPKTFPPIKEELHDESELFTSKGGKQAICEKKSVQSFGRTTVSI
ncbi:unnamed protein product [Timema podura]|uniref:Uncharacterized protein n=1 Tax=Timema podura TaxID=61482 RepID=A0ABN7NTQ4_TIMPD|nr:unnamed protein product [Timema podura]